MTIRGRYLVAGIAAACLVAASAGAEVEIKASTALPVNNDYTKSLQANFISKVNDAGKGVVKIRYLGGPEVTPPAKAANALARGVVDMLHSPASYYEGTVPESLALFASNRPVGEIRKTESWALIEKIWEEKLKAKIVAWPESETQYNIYLVEKPERTANGGVSLKGMKIRSAPTYRPLLHWLGATTVAMKASEIYTGLQRGVVQGFGWPELGLGSLGVHKLVKYRIGPSFYRGSTLLLVNLDKWQKLPSEARALIEKAGREYENSSIAYMEQVAKEEIKLLGGGTVELIELQGAARDEYLRVAYEAMWDRLEKTSKHTQQLKRDLYRQ